MMVALMLLGGRSHVLVVLLLDITVALFGEELVEIGLQLRGAWRGRPSDVYVLVEEREGGQLALHHLATERSGLAGPEQGDAGSELGDVVTDFPSLAPDFLSDFSGGFVHGFLEKAERDLRGGSRRGAAPLRIEVDGEARVLRNPPRDASGPALRSLGRNEEDSGREVVRGVGRSFGVLGQLSGARELVVWNVRDMPDGLQQGTVRGAVGRVDSVQLGGLGLVQRATREAGIRVLVLVDFSELQLES